MRILLIFAGRDSALASTLCRGAGRRASRQREPPHAVQPTRKRVARARAALTCNSLLLPFVKKY